MRRESASDMIRNPPHVAGPLAPDGELVDRPEMRRHM